MIKFNKPELPKNLLVLETSDGKALDFTPLFGMLIYFVIWFAGFKWVNDKKKPLGFFAYWAQNWKFFAPAWLVIFFVFRGSGRSSQKWLENSNVVQSSVKRSKV